MYLQTHDSRPGPQGTHGSGELRCEANGKCGLHIRMHCGKHDGNAQAAICRIYQPSQDGATTHPAKGDAGARPLDVVLLSSRHAPFSSPIPVVAMPPWMYRVVVSFPQGRLRGYKMMLPTPPCKPLTHSSPVSASPLSTYIKGGRPEDVVTCPHPSQAPLRRRPLGSSHTIRLLPLRVPRPMTGRP